jgi:hypothetical protein
MKTGYNTIFVAIDSSHVDSIKAGFNSKLCTFPGTIGDLGRMQQRLCWNAASVQTCAADLVGLDENDALS